MPVQRSESPVSSERLEATALDLLEASTLFSLATVTPQAGAYVNTAYFARGPRFQLVWLSDPDARHSRNLSESASAAITVYDSQQTWGRPDRGIQLFGAAHAAGEEAAGAAEDVYAARFPDFRAKNLWAYRFYVFQPERVKLFDEVGLGGGRFVVAAVDESGRLSWETTEIYRSES